jgi:putative effector of murein hydrolase
MSITDPSSAPLLYLALTFVVYAVTVEVSRRARGHPLANPVLLSVCCLITLLWLARLDYQHYFANVQLIHFLLGPATVALAVPLFRQRHKVRQVSFAHHGWDTLRIGRGHPHRHRNLRYSRH